MTYTATPSFLSRSGALACSALIHAGIGVALFVNFTSGAPEEGMRAGDRGHVLVVELLPLPEGGSPAQGEAQQERSDSDEHGRVPDAGDGRGPLETGSALALGSPPPGDGGNGDDDGQATMTDSPEGAPALAGTEVQAFRARLLQHIERYRRYPPEARAAGHEGVVRVHFVMDRSGKVLDAWIELSSGSPLLDEEAVAAVRRAAPLPAPPASWPNSFAVALPIGYSLQ